MRHHLNGPLGLVVAPGGNILTVNSGDGNLVETTPSGFQIAVRQLDSSGSPPGPAPCSGWRSSRSTAPSTSWTTPPTRSTCSTNRLTTVPRSRLGGTEALAAAYSVTPTRTGSGVRQTPNVSRTPSLISRASAIRLAVLADPELTRASVCFDEIRAPSPGL